MQVCFYFYRRAARFAKPLEPSSSWRRRRPRRDRRAGAGTGSRETSAVVAHQLPQITLVVAIAVILMTMTIAVAY